MPDQPHTLSRLLAPRSVALVGASENAARIGGRPLRYLREGGFAGVVYPVNPNRETVQGLPAYASVAALPQTPDVALLAVPAADTLRAVRDCADRQVPAAVIFSAGFAEQDEAGARLQAEIAEIGRASGMRILGPNCLGVFNSALGFYGTFSAILDRELVRPGPVAVVSQSGAYGSHVTHLARERGLGVGLSITTGNECDVGLAEALGWVVEQPDVTVVIAYAEGVRDGEGFTAALDAARRAGKAVVVMKVGRSEVGARAVSSHTAALAGSDAVFDAVLRQFGAYRARTTAEQLDIAYACARGVYPAGNKLGIFTMSGGFGIQMADDATSAGLDVAAMPDAARAKLKAMLPYASPDNPVDATAQVVTDLPLMTDFIRAMLTEGGYGMFAGIFGMGPSTASFAATLREALETATAGLDRTVLALTMSAPREIVRSYEEKGFLVFEDGSQLTTALGALVHFARSFARWRGPGGEAASPQVARPAPARTSPSGKGSMTAPLSEHGAKAILREAGIPFPDERLVGPDADVGAAAAAIGFPVVLKIVSPDIPHKTEVGGVAVGLRDTDAARQTAAAMLARVRERRPDARIDGLLVAPMVSGGVDTIVGVVRDPVFGPVVMFGLGGIFVEVLKDVTFRVAPFDEEEARRMIREIKSHAVLEGVRGAPPSDVGALASILSSLSRFAADHADRIESIDLNPVVALPEGEGAVPLDALVEWRKAAGEPRHDG